jgi:Tfp pilus assembly protein PilV
MTLVETMIILVFIGLGYVGVAKLMSHALRLSERAAVRSEMTALALGELERLRVEATTDPNFRPAHVHALPGRRFELVTDHTPAADGALMAIRVTARALQTDPPFEVSLTGWVASGEAGV